MLDLWPPRLIADPGGGHHSSAVLPFPLNLDLTQNPPQHSDPGTCPPKTSEIYLPPLVNHFILLYAAGTKCRSQNSGPSSFEPHLQNKLTLEERNPLNFLIYSPNIWNHLFMDYKGESASSCWQLILLHVLCQNPIKYSFLSSTPIPEFEFLKIRPQKSLVNSDVPPAM